MTKAGSTISEEDRALAPVFISYATNDRTAALKVCEAIERHGTKCWISLRDVAPGANYQEAIVQSIRTTRAMVLVFSEAANNSDEIKKELSLASRFHVPVIALRLEDVEPSDAFAYELSTRQWINVFEGWDKSIDVLVERIGQISPGAPVTGPSVRQGSQTRMRPRRRRLILAGSASFLFLAAAGAWFTLRPQPSPSDPHSMQVRLSGFQLLSTDLPATMPDAISSEIIAAFNEDGAVAISTASAAAPGTAPAYALGGTIQREGQGIRVITRLTNERSGATLWSDNFNYAGNEASKVPRHIAVDAGNIVRCGLFGTSTYQKPLPDNVLRDYMQFCQGFWDPDMRKGRESLIPAQRVVAAVPDFSWGWAAVAGSYWKVAMSADDDRLAEEARASGREAADRAVAIDGRNSEALYIKSRLIDRQDWAGRENLLKRAVEARRLDCGCEHHQYGEMLLSVGRVREAVDELRQANDMLALYVYTPLSLANALVAAGKSEEARPYFEAASQLAPNSGFAEQIAIYEASLTGNLSSLSDPKLPLPPQLRTALLKGHRAVASQNAGEKAEAVQRLLELPKEDQDPAVARLLAELGADREAFEIAARLATRQFIGPSIFWHLSMRGTLSHPDFPMTAAKLGLMNYWKTTRTKPDACNDAAPPPFCRMI